MALGPRHDDSFVACWRCVGDDPAAIRVARNEDFVDEEVLELEEPSEIARLRGSER